jgi:hypothetical protein
MSDPVDAATHRVAEAPHAPPAKTSVQPTKDTAVSPGNWSDPEKELHDIEDALVELETAMKDVASLTSKGASKSALSGPDREKLVSARDLLDQAKTTELGRAGILRAGAVIAGNASSDAVTKLVNIENKLGGITKELAAAKGDSLKELEAAKKESLRELAVAKRDSLAKARTFKAAAEKEEAAWRHLAAKHPKDGVIAEFSRRADNDKREAKGYIENSIHPEKLADP